MKVLLATLESYYANSLALEYLRGYALADAEVSAQAEIQVSVYPPDLPSRQVLGEILNQEPDVLGFSTYLWNIEKTLQLAERVRAARPHVLIVLGGLEVTYDATLVLEQNRFVDAVVTGEGEIPFREMLRALIRDGEFRDGLPGTFARKGEQILRSGPPESVETLDDIPSPFRSHALATDVFRGDILYESYRGCSFKCAFCLYHRDYARVRRFSLERVQRDLTVLLASPCESIRFVDATFNIDPSRTKAILRMLQGCTKKVAVEVSAEFFDEEMIDMLPRAGIKHVDIGLQSTQREVLRSVNRAWHRPDRFANNLRLLREHPQLTLNIELICGLPGDDVASYRESVDDAVRYGPDHVSLYRLLLLKGSEIRKRATEYGMSFEHQPPYRLKQSKWLTEDDLAALDLMAFAHIVLFNVGIARWALRSGCAHLHATPTELYERFVGFCLAREIYDEQFMRWVSAWYAVGNRFDRPLPESLKIDYLRRICEDFFRSVALEAGTDEWGDVISELIEYGVHLARLDLIHDYPDHGRATLLSLADEVALAPSVLMKEFSQACFRELKNLGALPVEIPVDAAYAICFFRHAQLGPCSLVVGREVFNFLRACAVQVPIELLLSRQADSCSDVQRALLIRRASELVDMGLLVQHSADSLPLAAFAPENQKLA